MYKRQIKYCKDIYAPLHHVKYIATVGVSEETFTQYLDMEMCIRDRLSEEPIKRLEKAGFTITRNTKGRLLTEDEMMEAIQGPVSYTHLNKDKRQ